MAWTSKACSACSLNAVVKITTGGCCSLSRWRASSSPSIDGMWMSVSTRSDATAWRISIASRPLAASPTIASGIAPAQSSSRSRSRGRAGASSWTISTRSGASTMGNAPLRTDETRGPVAGFRRRLVRFVADWGRGRRRSCRRRVRLAIRHAQMDFVHVSGDLRFESALGVEMQREPFAHVRYRHLVAGVVPPAVGLIRIAQDRVHVAALEEDVDRHDAGRARRLDPVIDRVLEQRLQHERRNERVARHAVQMPLDLQAISEAQFFERQVLTAELDLVRERRELAVVAHQHAEEVRHILQRTFGLPRIVAHEREHGSDAVEQEMRADARLQRLQPRFGNGG